MSSKSTSSPFWTLMFLRHTSDSCAALERLIIELRYSFADQLFIRIAFKTHNPLLDPMGLASGLGGNFIASQTSKGLSDCRQSLSQFDYFSEHHAKMKMVRRLSQR